MGDQKQHHDVFGQQELLVLLFFVARTSVQNEHGSIIERPKSSPQHFTLRLNVRDEDLFQPHSKYITRDKAVLGRVESDIVRIISPLKKQRIDGDIFDNNGRFQLRAVQNNADNERHPP